MKELTFDQMSVCSFDKEICLGKKKSGTGYFLHEKLSCSNVRQPEVRLLKTSLSDKRAPFTMHMVCFQAAKGF